MRILVTAFGPFDGRPQNASSLALGGLKDRFPWIRSRLLPVDSVIAPLRMSQALRQVRPDAVIMLGEAAGSTAIRLETQAWNELDFSIPDTAGRQPRVLPIHAGGPDFLPSTLPWQAIHGKLAEAGHEVAFSDSAGRYLCNQVMFHTLHWIGKRQLAVNAGFIHVPLAQDYPTVRVVDALGQALGVVLAGRAVRFSRARACPEASSCSLPHRR
jgi:pyroglutamyl-peptidase